MMKKERHKYKIVTLTCDDLIAFDMILSYDELQIVIRLFEKNNMLASSCYTPHLLIYDYAGKDLSNYKPDDSLCYDFYDF